MQERILRSTSSSPLGPGTMLVKYSAALSCAQALPDGSELPLHRLDDILLTGGLDRSRTIMS